MPELRFRVISAHPTVNSGQLVCQLAADVPALAEHLREKWPMLPDLSVEADREKSVPIDPDTAFLVLTFLGAAFASGFLEKFGEKFGEDAYTFLKNRITNGSIERPENPEQ
jgi:hypothetical protein